MTILVVINQKKHRKEKKKGEKYDLKFTSLLSWRQTIILLECDFSLY